MNIVKITEEILKTLKKLRIETDAAEGPPEGTSHPLAEAAPT